MHLKIGSQCHVKDIHIRAGRLLSSNGSSRESLCFDSRERYPRIKNLERKSFGGRRQEWKHRKYRNFLREHLVLSGCGLFSLLVHQRRHGS